MRPSEQLSQMNLTLPEPAKPVGSYIPAIRTGSLVYTSGQLPMVSGELSARGCVEREVSCEAAATAAHRAVLNALGAVAGLTGSIDTIARIVHMNVYVASCDDFHDQSTVANGASDLLHTLFGQAGQHTRSAVGVRCLPLNSPVEVDLVVEIRDVDGA